MADRIEREIEEILKKIDNFVPESGNRTRRPAPPKRPTKPIASAQGWLARRVAAISLNHVMMWALFVVIVAFVARSAPGMSWVMIGAVIVFITAFFMSLGRGSKTAKADKYWRERPLDLSEPGMPDRIKAWIKGRKKA